MNTRESIIAESLASENVEYVTFAERCFVDTVCRVRGVYQKWGRQAPEIPKVMVYVNDWDLPEGKVGSYTLPNENHEYGMLTVSPGAFNGEKAPYWFVIAHEVIHVFLGPESESHDGDFNLLAEELGIPVEYRD